MKLFMAGVLFALAIGAGTGGINAKAVREVASRV